MIDAEVPLSREGSRIRGSWTVYGATLEGWPSVSSASSLSIETVPNILDLEYRTYSGTQSLSSEATIPPECLSLGRERRAGAPSASPAAPVFQAAGSRRKAAGVKERASAGKRFAGPCASMRGR